MADTRLTADAKKTAELSITIKGARSREAALSTILDMLKPEWAAVAKVAESSNGFKQDGDFLHAFRKSLLLGRPKMGLVCSGGHLLHCEERRLPGVGLA